MFHYYLICAACGTKWQLKHCCLQKITLSPCSTLCHLGFELLVLFAMYFIFHEYLSRTLLAPEDYRSSYFKTYARTSLCVMEKHTCEPTHAKHPCCDNESHQ